MVKHLIREMLRCPLLEMLSNYLSKIALRVQLLTVNIFHLAGTYVENSLEAFSVRLHHCMTH